MRYAVPGADIPEDYQEESFTDGFNAWKETVQAIIAKYTDQVEVNLFIVAGVPRQPLNELEDKIAYVRNDLMPMIRAGYWSPEEQKTRKFWGILLYPLSRWRRLSGEAN